MPKVLHPDTLGLMFDRILERLGLLESARRSQVAVVPADPANPVDGDMWVRTSDNTLHVRVNGVTKTVTIT